MNAVTAAAWIELENVSKRYGRQPVLEAAYLTIARGQMVAVMGRSGSGKSTLLRLIGGLEAADAGIVRVDGTDLTALTETERARRRRHGLGFVFQSFNLIPTLTVGENVELPLALNEVPAVEVRRRSRALLDELGLASCADRFPEDISGGEQQRVAIARAVIHEPKLVLADEPTGNLDVETAHHVLELLQRTCRERSTTLIVATHSAEVAALAARVLTIRAGRIEDAAP
jgi:putative ABC transport system ATP-binding protein